jgi:hypothetical protein
MSKLARLLDFQVGVGSCEVNELAVSVLATVLAMSPAAARSASVSTIDSRAWSPAPKRTICPGPHSRPARSVSAAGRASAENSESCDTARTVEQAFERAVSARRQLSLARVWQLGAWA